MLRPFFHVIWLWIVVFGFVSSSWGQYAIQLQLDKKLFLSQETMTATVTVANQSGADVVMGGPANMNWLQFHLTDASGRQFPPIGVEVEEPFVFKAGTQIKKQVLISDTHAVSEIGTYAATAVIYHAPTQDHYQSNRIQFTVTDVQPLWSNSFGVPQGFPEAGRVRNFTLHVLREGDGSRLYVRLTDERSNLRIATYSLGPISQALDPSFAVDNKNQLQAFFLTTPKLFAHCVVGPDGELVSRRYYRELENNRPALVSRGNEISVAGGVLFDPNAAAAEGSGKGTRSVSQRPPGL